MYFKAEETIYNRDSIRPLYKVDYYIDDKTIAKAIDNKIRCMRIPGFTNFDDDWGCYHLTLLNVTPNSLVTLRYYIQDLVSNKYFEYGDHLKDNHMHMYASPKAQCLKDIYGNPAKEYHYMFDDSLVNLYDIRIPRSCSNISSF